MKGEDAFNGWMEASMRTEASHHAIHVCSRCLQGSIEQLRFRADDHPPVAGELEVCGRGAQIDLADQLAGRIPYVDAIAAAGVDVAI